MEFRYIFKIDVLRKLVGRLLVFTICAVEGANRMMIKDELTLFNNSVMTVYSCVFVVV
jgi:hypothetical protein